MTVDGESAVSTGPMVPVFASNDEGRSRAALAILDAAGIPALLDADVRGAFVGFHEPVPEGWRQVLVPTTMRAEALDVLRKHEGEIEEPRRARPQGAFEVPRPASRGLRSPTALPPRASGEPATRAEWGPSVSAVPGLAPGDEDEGPADVALPDSGPVQPRLVLALLALAFGGAMQQILTVWVGEPRLMAALAARAPFWEDLHTLVTASFLHGGPGHFLSNAAFGLVFGVVLFGTHRPGAAALVWLLASAVGLSAEVSLSPDVHVIGASAGNYGLVGLWAHGQLERARVALLPRRERLKTLGVLLLLVPGALTPFSSTGTRIAVLAHVAGFGLGYLAGLVFHRRLLPSGFESIDRRSRAAGLAALALGAAGWLVGLLGLA
jgi:membrane associated rhomboid family serine protease